ncbi:MAG: DUF3137 domain-containing protein [Alphaproteobacteria bacterium]|nr:DUF3137 domain-containing protein [Alphaproteobacteria bacterium]
MISKQDFLRAVQTEIFPILKQNQGKMKRYSWLSKAIIISSFVLMIFFSLLYAYLCDHHVLNTHKWVYFLLIFSFLVITGLALEFYNRCCKRIKSMVNPKIFYLLGLDNNIYFDNPLKEMAGTGIFPYFDDKIMEDSFNYEIGDSFAIRETQHSLFVQEVELENENNRRRQHIFSGIVISAKQLRPVDFSLLILDKKSSKAKLSEVKIKWQKIAEDFPDKEFLFYTDNPQACMGYLTPTFISVIEKLKADGEEPLNILFHNGKIFLAFSTHRDLFEYINWDNFSDIEPYEELYDDIQSIHQVDELLMELEEKY